MNEELKPCANCGQGAGYEEQRQYGGVSNEYRALCECGMATEWMTSKALVAETWNRRASGWRPISEAPKGNGNLIPDRTSPKHVNPPRLWLLLESGKRCVGYWDWYYAPNGRGHDGGSAWVEEYSGERVTPTHFQPLPDPPEVSHE